MVILVVDQVKVVFHKLLIALYVAEQCIGGVLLKLGDGFLAEII